MSETAVADAKDLDKSTSDVSATKTGVQPEEEKNPVYTMTGSRRALIINIIKSTKWEKPREGAEVDSVNMKNMFNMLGFINELKENISCDNMKELFKNVGKEELTIYDCFACVLMSHGHNDSIFGINNETLKLHEIFANFGPARCPSLEDKPKLFFIQSCRGTMRDTGIVEYDTQPVPDEIRISVPNEKDFLIHFSTPPGHLAARLKDTGTWFIEDLASVFEDNKEKNTMEIFQLLTEVNMKVAERKLGKPAIKQVPFIASTLTKELHLKTSPSGKTMINSPVYEMNNKRRRAVLIFRENGSGKKKDVDKLCDLFTQLGFDGKLLSNSESLPTEISHAVTAQYESDCIVCVIFSSEAFSRSHPKRISDIFESLKKCTALAGKPKLIFLIACQSDISFDAKPFIAEDEILIPREADILVVNSHVLTESEKYPDDTSNESLFIQEIASALLGKYNSTNDNLINLITRVFGAISEKVQSHRIQHVPFVTSTLRKRLYLRTSTNGYIGKIIREPGTDDVDGDKNETGTQPFSDNPDMRVSQCEHGSNQARGNRNPICSFITGVVYDPLEGGWVVRKDRPATLSVKTSGHLSADGIVFVPGKGWVSVERNVNYNKEVVVCSNIDGLEFSFRKGWKFTKPVGSSASLSNKGIRICRTIDSMIYDPFRGGWIARDESDYTHFGKIICDTDCGMLYEIGSGWVRRLESEL